MFTQSPVKIWRNQKKIRNFLGKVGIIQSYTIIRIPPVGYEPQAPYPVVLVDFLPAGRHGGNEKIVGQLVDYEQKHIKIGQKVQAILRKIKDPGVDAIIPYGIKFKPI